MSIVNVCNHWRLRKCFRYNDARRSSPISTGTIHPFDVGPSSAVIAERFAAYDMRIIVRRRSESNDPDRGTQNERGYLEDEDRDRRTMGDGRGWVLLAVSIGWFLSYGVRMVYPIFAPFFQAEFGLTLTTTGLLLSTLWGPTLWGRSRAEYSATGSVKGESS